MILYQLICKDEHSFESWFRDSAAFDELAAARDIECPYCAGTEISKAPMAPRVCKGRQDVDKAARMDAVDVAERLLDAVEVVRRHAEENFEDVGESFAEEARKIHYGEADERGIYGRASEDDAHELEEEGIDFIRLPPRARRGN
ncbi:DUF1178 family protein [Varunaivibrio sulfuroxidans]|uniref:DUF1178 family protein n=1 Tax=Varunaivibrio sulfuroxidans TaxID=1773489 RepID=A0A4R3JI85_9PROT|nr:DUF1178 family protein [Varunaivibrio sulfuroxidans]TCS65093.1 hypothetical protein EDD55_101427 [Varunaivibrio sulfuroxidans]WES29621.1 DUF1178 family protein [Varunaivibrio sulfuroxidans]